jgi:hypothetical protein
MRKFYAVLLLILSVLLIESSLYAGTLNAGVQSWYVFWDSGLAKMNAQVIENQIKKELNSGIAGLPEFVNYEGLEIDNPESKGFILGPLLSYKTDDTIWEFRASMMLIGSYSTNVDSTVTVSGTFPIVGPATMPLTINTELTIDYKDIDLRAGRMITDKFGLFAGYIYQSYKSELESDYDFTFASTSMNSALNFKLDAYMHMIYGGVSFEQPVSSIFTAKANLGCGTPVAGKVEQNMKISGSFFNDDIVNDGGEVKSALMLFAELAVTAKVFEKINLDLGYQYRRLNIKVEKLDLEADGSANDTADETDIFQGITFAATYSFNL